MIIGFSTTNKIGSRIIRFFTKSSASHSYILVEIAGEPIVIHANQHGVNCDHYKKFKKDKKIVAEYKLLIGEEDEKRALSRALRLLDKPYDFLSIVGFGWVLICKAIGLTVKNPFPCRSAYQCSEFALDVLKSASLNGGLEKLDPELVAPETLMAYLGSNTKVERV